MGWGSDVQVRWKLFHPPFISAGGWPQRNSFKAKWKINEPERKYLRNITQTRSVLLQPVTQYKHFSIFLHNIFSARTMADTDPDTVASLQLFLLTMKNCCLLTWKFAPTFWEASVCQETWFHGGKTSVEGTKAKTFWNLIHFSFNTRAWSSLLLTRVSQRTFLFVSCLRHQNYHRDSCVIRKQLLISIFSRLFYWGAANQAHRFMCWHPTRKLC